jgi:glycine cleavage system regulatory protein
MTTSVILTVVGSDRPGLTQALSEAVVLGGGNWLESHLTKLAGKYVGSVLVELPEDKLSALIETVRRVDEAGLSVTLIPAGSAGQSTGEPLLLDLYGQDRQGIVHEVTTALADIGVNIEDFASTVSNTPWSGARLFRAKARLIVPPGTSVDAVQEALEGISGDIMVELAAPAADPR